MTKKKIFTRFFCDTRLAHITSIVLFLVLVTMDQSIAKDREPVTPRDQKIAELELAVQKIIKQIAVLKTEPGIEEKNQEIEKADESTSPGSTRRRSWLNKFSLGGYGEIPEDLQNSC